jgi:hypothetical protein
VLGTPGYMAPELIRGKMADARSDLYAAGVIQYQSLVGERPFAGGLVAVMQKVLIEAPKPPSTHHPSIPEPIDTVVLRALAKSANDRFASAAEFSRELIAAVRLAGAEDESESTMIMSAAKLKAVQEGVISPADRTSTGKRTGNGTSSTYTGTRTCTDTGTGTRTRGTGATGHAAAAAAGLGGAPETEAQADAFMASSDALLADSGSLQAAGQAIGAFVAESYALAPASQKALYRRQGDLSEAIGAQEALARCVEREGKAAPSCFERKLEVPENRLAAQDGAWGSESRAL